MSILLENILPKVLVWRQQRQELMPSVQVLAACAASLAKAESAKNISAPNSAYQFEVSWWGPASDRNSQARLLKATSPTALPEIFKNPLSAPTLMDTVRCIATFFIKEMDLAANYLENLTKIPRFNMIIMCLSSSDKADLAKIWDEAFGKTAPEYAEIVSSLQQKYQILK